MTRTAQIAVELMDIQCGNCGVPHSMPKEIYENAKRLGGWWWCPNGHQRGWEKGTEHTRIKELEAQLAAEKQRKDNALARANEAADAQRRAEASLTRHKKRAAAGTCPCCKRTFQQLARHMACKHPEFK